MNAKQVLSRIASLLSVDEKVEVLFTEAKATNGDILSSPTFDLNEDVEVVSEDGTKSPAPDGEYEISLKDESGNENIIRIEVKDGKVQERENVEEAKNAEKPKAENEEEMGYEGEDSSKVVKGLEMAAAETKEAHALPMTTDEDPRNRVGSDADDKKDPTISLSYRIQELEDKMKKLYEKFETEAEAEVETESEEDMEDVPVLDGAPVEMNRVNLSSQTKQKKSEGDYQNSFLSKLYK